MSICTWIIYCIYVCSRTLFLATTSFDEDIIGKALCNPFLPLSSATSKDKHSFTISLCGCVRIVASNSCYMQPTTTAALAAPSGNFANLFIYVNAHFVCSLCGCMGAHVSSLLVFLLFLCSFSFSVVILYVFTENNGSNNGLGATEPAAEASCDEILHMTTLVLLFISISLRNPTNNAIWCRKNKESK